MNFNTRGLKVMVVDPDRTVLEIVQLRLQVAGYDPCMARMGVPALEALRNFRPAALIIELNLPDMNGLDVIQALNPAPSPNRPFIPTILMARKLGEADIRRAVSLGVRDCMTKPFSGEDILVRVARLLRRPVAAPAPPSAPSRPTMMVG